MHYEYNRSRFQVEFRKCELPRAEMLRDIILLFVYVLRLCCLKILRSSYAWKSLPKMTKLYDMLAKYIALSNYGE